MASYEEWEEPNSFCRYCTAGDRKEIIDCEFKDCPFYSNRFSNWTMAEEADIAKKMMKDIGVIK